MAIKDEDQIGVGVAKRDALASLLGLDTATTQKLVADVKGAAVPALSPVVIAADGTAKVYAADTAAPTIGETDKLGFTVGDRVSDKDGNLNAAVMRQAHVRRPRLSAAAKAALTAAPAAALSQIIIEEA